MTRVLVAGGERMWRAAVAAALTQAGFRVADVDTGYEAVRLTLRTAPEVALLTARTPAIGQLLQVRRDMQVLIVSADGEEADVLAAMWAGATGHVMRSASIEQILDAVRRAARGETVITPALASLVVEQIRPQLTEREVEVLRLVAIGLSDQVISSRLHIPERTVHKHLRTALLRLRVHAPAESLQYALRRGGGTTGSIETADRARRPVPIQIYLQNGWRSAEVEQAVRELLDITGFEVESAEPPVVGSWFRKLIGRSKEALTSEELADKLILLQRAIELKTLDKPQSEVDSATVDAVAKLIEALSGETNAAIQLGSVFLLKVDGSLAVRNLSQHELAFLRDNSSLFSSPRRLLDALDGGGQLCISPPRGKQSNVKDDEILARINELVDEEHSLRGKLRAGEVSAADEHERIKQLEVTLDRCWDLLRQRRALRDAHADPEQAKARPATEVEGYQQ